jgi:hypothetical protein
VSNDRDRFEKVLALAINPGAVEGEAIAALHRARQLVKQNPSLAHPPQQPPAPVQQPSLQATFKVKITSVHPDWILILVGLLSKRAYELELRSKIEFDFGERLTAIYVVCDGSQASCTVFEKHIEWCVNYINQQLKREKATAVGHEQGLWQPRLPRP